MLALQDFLLAPVPLHDSLPILRVREPSALKGHARLGGVVVVEVYKSLVVLPVLRTRCITRLRAVRFASVFAVMHIKGARYAQ